MSGLKNVRVLTGAAMLLAIAVILSFFKIPLTEVMEIRFANIPVAVAGMLFGPGVGGAVGALSDILGYAVRPTGPYFPGFTVTAALSGVIFGLLLGKNRFSVPRIVLACVIYQICDSLLLGAVWLHILYGAPYWTLVVSRLPKELVTMAFHIVVLVFLVRPAAALTRTPVKQEEKREENQP